MSEFLLTNVIVEICIMEITRAFHKQMNRDVICTVVMLKKKKKLVSILSHVTEGSLSRQYELVEPMLGNKRCMYGHRWR